MARFRLTVAAALFVSAFHIEAAPLQLDMTLLAQNKQRIDNADPAVMPAWLTLKRQANRALKQPLYSVTQKTMPAPSGDIHDYFSFSNYWWPNPNTSDGMPWVRKDGEINPAANSEQSNKSQLNSFSRDVWNLALAWQLSGNNHFAEKARDQLVNWFITPGTRMNPNLNWSQRIPGNQSIRGSGILDGRVLVKIIDAIEILHDGGKLDNKSYQAIRQWYQDYYQWLTTSAIGFKEDNAYNNHGTWYDVQVASIAWWLGDKKAARERLNITKMRRIPAQFTAQGEPQTEVDRTRSWHYSNFLLEAYIPLGRLGERANINLWQAGNGERRLENGYRFIAQFINTNHSWPYADSDRFNPQEALENMVVAASIWPQNIEFKTSSMWLIHQAPNSVIHLTYRL